MRIMRNFLRIPSNRELRAFVLSRLAGTLAVALCITLLAVSSAQAADFPLKTSANGRYLVDQQGKPFLLVGEAAWSLITQTTQADRDLYLDNRQAKGFNALLIQLIQHGNPKTHSGLASFLTPGDFSTPNPAYFDFAHKVIKQANDHGMVVFLAPAWLGYEGHSSYPNILKSGRKSLHDYGRFVGNKFKDLNVVWVVGGDFVPPADKRWTVTALAEGIHEADPTHLITVHNSRGIGSSKIYNDQPWLTIDGAYLRKSFAQVYAAYDRRPTRPIVLLEAYYEHRFKSYGPTDFRHMDYGVILAGACGQFIGNENLNNFRGNKHSTAPKLTWQQAMNSEGTHDTMRMRDLFKSLPWYELVPDQNHALVTGGYGTGPNAIIGAETADKTVAVLYIPSTGKKSRKFTVDMSRFAGPVTAQWYDPTNGAYTSVKDGATPNHGPHTFNTPGVNSAGAGDWVLLIKTTSPWRL